MTRAREFGLIILTAATILFAAQNLSEVEIAVLFWRFPVSVALIALVPLLIGLVVGTAGTAVRLKRRRRAAAAADEMERQALTAGEVDGEMADEGAADQGAPSGEAVTDS
jgi:uncharacterized integral membrane protein